VSDGRRIISFVTLNKGDEEETTTSPDSSPSLEPKTKKKTTAILQEVYGLNDEDPNNDGTSRLDRVYISYPRYDG